MIFSALFGVFRGAINILLLPLEIVNIAIDFVSSIPVLVSFFQVIAYIIPWSNILPLIILTISFGVFKIVVSLLKTIWDILPIL